MIKELTQYYDQAVSNNYLSLTEKQLENFFSKIGYDPIYKCFVWDGYLNNDGYGVININSKVEKAHRIMFQLIHGSILKGCVCHKCDRPFCVTPEHLFDGTRKDNSSDMSFKKRCNNGKLKNENHPMCKLTDEQVKEIRSFPKNKGYQRYLAEFYGVTQANISCIINNKSRT